MKNRLSICRGLVVAHGLGLHMHARLGSVLSICRGCLCYRSSLCHRRRSACGVRLAVCELAIRLLHDVAWMDDGDDRVGHLRLLRRAVIEIEDQARVACVDDVEKDARDAAREG